MQFMHQTGIFAFANKHKNVLKIVKPPTIYHKIHVFNFFVNMYNIKVMRHWSH